MKILAIETSCDETAIAILGVTATKNPKGTILAHQVASQIALHEQYGGVFPMMAKREHSRNIVPLFLATLKEAGLLSQAKISTLTPVQEKKLRTLLEREPELLELFLQEIPKIKKPKIDRIAVTVGPGLAPALWVGINFAKALAYVWDLPLVPVNHMEGHVLSIVVPNKKNESFTLNDKAFHFPAISLLVSGGHTEIVLAKGIGKYKVIGQTRDDAAGEAFDKVARMLGLPYPGGPQISKLAEQARKTDAVSAHKILLPRPMLTTSDFDFSFSGLKTAVLYLIRDIRLVTKAEELDENTKMVIAREFEDAAVEVLVKKTLRAAVKHKATNIVVGGGVSANKELATQLTSAAKKAGITVTFPTKVLSTDNGIMIAIAGCFSKPAPLSSKKFVAQGNMAL